MIKIADYISVWPSSLFGNTTMAPWDATAAAEKLINSAIKSLGNEYQIENNIAVHNSAVIEVGSILKGPAIIGENCFIAAAAYLRGGVFLDKNCIIGPACELKTTFMFSGSKIAHLSFVGDSIIGSNANIEAGAIVANYRNEMDDKRILIQTGNDIIDTGVDKFGALIGDDTRIGANAVIAPGALIPCHHKVPRLGHIDQHPSHCPIVQKS